MTCDVSGFGNGCGGEIESYCVIRLNFQIPAKETSFKNKYKSYNDLYIRSITTTLIERSGVEINSEEEESTCEDYQRPQPPVSTQNLSKSKQKTTT